MEQFLPKLSKKEKEDFQCKVSKMTCSLLLTFIQLCFRLYVTYITEILTEIRF